MKYWCFFWNSRSFDVFISFILSVLWDLKTVEFLFHFKRFKVDQSPSKNPSTVLFKLLFFCRTKSVFFLRIKQISFLTQQNWQWKIPAIDLAWLMKTHGWRSQGPHNLRSGVIFFPFFCFFAYKGLIGRGHDLRLRSTLIFNCTFSDDVYSSHEHTWLKKP